MSFIAEFRVEISPLAHASSAVPEMQFSGEDLILEDDFPAKFMFTAHGTQINAFERALDEDPTVADYTVLERFAETAYYIVTYAPDVIRKGTYHIAVEQDIAYLTIELQDGEFTVRARVPERAALAALREYCRENDIPFQLDRIYQEDSPDAPVNTLTEAQREALEVAYEYGYFNSPRETTLEAIAKNLEISRQAVADRLRRGHKRLLEATIV